MALLISPGALVCEDARVEGDVTIGSGTVVHPRCSILATSGPIVIGPDCVIEEQVVIVNDNGGGGGDGGDGAVMEIGGMNLFEVGCVVEAARVGSCNVVEPKAVLGRGCVVGDGCVVAATVKVEAAAAVPDETVLYRAGPEGKQFARLQPRSKARHATQITRYLEILREPESRCCILNFHNLKT